MASRTNYFPSQIQSPTDHCFEFHESDIWNSDDATDRGGLPISSPSESRQSIQIRSHWKRSSARKATALPAPSSLPVNVPDWSKILGASGARWSRDGEGEAPHHADVDGGDEEEQVPPHEYAARQLARRSGTVVAFSLHEGVGRTLKGRDLSRVRNAIWKQTGFED